MKSQVSLDAKPGWGWVGANYDRLGASLGWWLGLGGAPIYTQVDCTAPEHRGSTQQPPPPPPPTTTNPPPCTSHCFCTSQQAWKELRTLGVVGEHGMTAKSAALDSDTDFLFGLRRVGEELVKTWDFLNKPGIS